MYHCVEQDSLPRLQGTGKREGRNKRRGEGRRGDKRRGEENSAVWKKIKDKRIMEKERRKRTAERSGYTGDNYITSTHAGGGGCVHRMRYCRGAVSLCA